MTRQPCRYQWSLVLVVLLTAGVTVGLSGGLTNPDHAVAAVTSPTPSTGSAKSEEGAPRVLLLGATIFGTVAAPNVPYELPWQEPFLLGRGASELERNFLKEIFRPIDREEFLKSTSSPEPSGK